ncbi:mfs multidrug transporter [Apiospora rasikravindrae]|uniref:Mfs multidrug transporter n=1 Tax=Apiospora rasikravindrae TaxID=990691 RepID=A0ABR1S051_9PEZI
MPKSPTVSFAPEVGRDFAPPGALPPPRPKRPATFRQSWLYRQSLPNQRTWRSSFRMPGGGGGGGRANLMDLNKRTSIFNTMAQHLDQIFYQQSALPEQWLFEIPDYNFADLSEIKEKRRSTRYEAFYEEKDEEEDEDEKEAPDPKKDLQGFKINFAPGHDPANPKCWSTAYKMTIVAGFAYTALSTGIYSTAYSSGIPEMSRELHIADPTLPSLGISLYLVGLAFGALIMAPLSETFGRRPMYIAGMSTFVALIPVAALSNNFLAVLLARFFGAVAGSVMLSNVAGSIIDIIEPGYLPLALSVYNFGPLNGPVLGPLVGGFLVQAFGFRALSWLSFITCGLGAVFIMTIPETYRPVLLRKLAAQRRAQENDDRFWSEHDADGQLPLLRRVKTAVSRPFALSFTQPVLMFWNVYISVIYAIAQLAFIAFPIVFTQIRGWSTAMSGLAFIGIFVGIALVLANEPLLRRLVNHPRLHPKNPDTGRPEPEASVSVVCIGAVLAPVGQLWFALTSLPVEVPFYWSVLSGAPFGFGFALVFIYGTGYVSAVFGIYATSASSGNLVFRSLLGAALPLYAALTPRTAGIVIGAVELALAPIPFIFYKYGKSIRQRSALIRELEAKARQST